MQTINPGKIMTRLIWSALFAILMTGCSMSPSISVVGSYFPDWLFCIVGGIILTLIVRSLLIHTKNDHALGPPVMVNPTLATLFSLLIWLIFFQH